MIIRFRALALGRLVVHKIVRSRRSGPGAVQAEIRDDGQQDGREGLKSVIWKYPPLS